MHAKPLGPPRNEEPKAQIGAANGVAWTLRDPFCPCGTVAPQQETPLSGHGRLDADPPMGPRYRLPVWRRPFCCPLSLSSLQSALPSPLHTTLEPSQGAGYRSMCDTTSAVTTLQRVTCLAQRHRVLCA